MGGIPVIFSVTLPRYVPTRLIFVSLCAAIALLAIAKPERPDPSPKRSQPIPQIAGPSRWGDISQDGKGKITIDGHERWYVERGEVRPDGTIIVIWIQRSDGAPAPGVYKLSADGSITGRWGWGTDAKERKDGTFDGLTSPDTLREAAIPDI